MTPDDSAEILFQKGKKKAVKEKRNEDEKGEKEGST